MRLLKLDQAAVNSFGFTCVQCRQRKDSQYGGYADLDGPSFSAYLCKDCGDRFPECHMLTDGPPADRLTTGQ
jgi:hypothetical protein